MVRLWLPELPNDGHIDEIEATENVTMPAIDTSDTEDEENPYEGYEPLPLNPTDVEQEASSEEEDSLNSVSSNSNNVLPIEPIDNVLIKDVWSGPAPQFVDIEMSSAKVDEVKLAMANFTLPTSSFPEWATTIPEEQWEEQLIKRIQNFHHRKNEN